ncbi:TVP38/TMEM64 family protein [Tuanshanicoccus lijuaniae]|uniref:TVP38/TMEM64 family protein n=1 Tax=Aerococcaceae bacterium zg-1292 TaxID=2774330 RepID=UPI001BD8151E|nr:TVP38/TMEM64 family protein [Aerococcaceae bacterium zg-BR22]MBS4455555.1 TVP38/TMEM64 family protein [Aerococcaceae bacterium zg-A91]MBS4457174.1 TVP38/TMEM64 family protein [Aerococcaceae bacterium zg-BR33]
MSSESVKTPIFHIISLVGIIGCGFLAIWCYQSGLLTSVDTLHQTVHQFGLLGILLFIAIQIIQVVIPVIPGGISTVAGVVIFGAVEGFWWNYIGICVGSMIAFGIAKYYGRPLLHQLFSQQTIKKYDAWVTKDRRFTRCFALAIFFPVAPDDFLCYLAGTTAMDWKTFSLIIWLGKPLSIAAYSIGLKTFIEQALPLFN